MSLIGIISQMTGGGSITPPPSGNYNSPASLSADYLSFVATLGWPTSGADYYELQAATVSDYSDADLIYSGALLTFDHPVQLNKAYYFRVRGTDGTNVGSWVNQTLSALSDGTTGETVHLFGDSITADIGASPSSNGYRRLLIADKSWTFGTDGGFSGYTITSNTCRPVFALSNVPTKTNADNYLFFAFGVNDAFVNPEITPSAYQGAIEAAITNANGKGWPNNRIIILSPFFTTFDGDSINYCGSDLSDEARKQLFVTAAQAGAGTCNYVDIFNHMKNNGGASLTSDEIHPNNAGHLVISNYLSSLIYI